MVANTNVSGLEEYSAAGFRERYGKPPWMDDGNGSSVIVGRLDDIGNALFERGFRTSVPVVPSPKDAGAVCSYEKAIGGDGIGGIISSLGVPAEGREHARVHEMGNGLYAAAVHADPGLKDYFGGTVEDLRSGDLGCVLSGVAKGAAEAGLYHFFGVKPGSMEFTPAGVFGKVFEIGSKALSEAIYRPSMN